MRTGALNYRRDIDGLRGVAILAVVFYHAFPQVVRGGFAGVDVFFVISGYLISAIILAGLEDGSFRFGDFYIRRIRRIFPALAVLLCACLLAGSAILLLGDFTQLGRHVAAGAAFLSNFVLWREVGYFDSAAHTKPLLHLWSLAVEEQFYLLWPALLWLAVRSGQSLPRFIALGAGISFALNLPALGQDAMASFYLPQMRFWELMCGALLAWVGRRRAATAAGMSAGMSAARQKDRLADGMSMAGALGLLCTVFLLGREQVMAGATALLPVASAVLLIAAGEHAWVNARVLAHRSLVAVGLISYSLYLWHWPILSFAEILAGEPLPAPWRAVLLGSAFVCAWLSVRFVEQPARFRGDARKVASWLVAGMFLLGAAGLLIGGMRAEFRPHMQEASAFLAHFDNSAPAWRYFREQRILAALRVECDFYDMDRYLAGAATTQPRPAIPPACYERDASRPKAVFLWGDSHAQHLYPGLRDALPADWQILQVASSGCAANAGRHAPSTENFCDQSNYFALQAIARARPEVVVLAQNLGHDPRVIGHIAAKLYSLGVQRVVLAGPTPHWLLPLPQIIVRHAWASNAARSTAKLDRAVLALNQELRLALAGVPGLRYVDLIGMLCNQGGCLTYLGEDRIQGITSWDYGHLTPVASRFVARGGLVEAIIHP